MKERVANMRCIDAYRISVHEVIYKLELVISWETIIFWTETLSLWYQRIVKGIKGIIINKSPSIRFLDSLLEGDCDPKHKISQHNNGRYDIWMASKKHKSKIHTRTIGNKSCILLKKHTITCSSKIRSVFTIQNVH